MNIRIISLYNLGIALVAQAGTSTETVEDVGVKMAAFYTDAINWGIEAGLLYLGGFAGLVVVFNFFRK